LKPKVNVDHCINRNRSGLQTWYDRHHRSDVVVRSSRSVYHLSMVLNIVATA
jgi:hypothetical protein